MRMKFRFACSWCHWYPVTSQV